jgi:hypothetical protein
VIQPKPVLILKRKKCKCIELAKSVGGIFFWIIDIKGRKPDFPACFRRIGYRWIHQKLRLSDIRSVVDNPVDVFFEYILTKSRWEGKQTKEEGNQKRDFNIHDSRTG